MLQRRLRLIILVFVQVVLVADFAAALIFTAPLEVDLTFEEDRLLFSAAQDIVVGRCVAVAWQVAAGEGVWINGQGRDLTGSEVVCINEDFSRPQIFALLPGGNAQLHELFVESALYSPNTALRFTLQGAALGLFFFVTVQLSGLSSAAALPGALRMILGAVPRQFERLLSDRVLYSLLIAGLILYAGVCLLHLQRVLPAQAFMSEDYLNNQTIGEAWENAIRPLTLPLIYKLLNNDLMQIARVQWGIAVIGWGSLALAVAGTLGRKLLKILGFSLILLLSLTRDIAFWNSMLLSEGLSNALFALLLGLALIIAQRWVSWSRFPAWQQGTAGIGLLVCAFFWSQTRDTNSYFLLGSAGLLAMFVAWRVIQARNPLSERVLRVVLPLGIALGFVLIFVQQDAHANRGLRWQYSLVNVMAHRILPDPERTAFFVERGMPNTPEVMAYAGQTTFAWSFSLDFPAFGSWIDNDAKRVYAEYLLSRPIESMSEPLRWWNRLLLYEHNLLIAYMESPYIAPWQRPLTALIYTETWGLLLLSAAGLLVFTLRLIYVGWDWRQSLPLLLVMLAYPLMFLNWHGDSHAVERHALHVALQWRLAMWLLLLFAVDQTQRTGRQQQSG